MSSMTEVTSTMSGVYSVHPVDIETIMSLAAITQNRIQNQVRVNRIHLGEMEASCNMSGMEDQAEIYTLDQKDPF